MKCTMCNQEMILESIQEDGQEDYKCSCGMEVVTKDGFNYPKLLGYWEK